jgi:hypothetical protein
MKLRNELTSVCMVKMLNVTTPDRVVISVCVRTSYTTHTTGYMISPISRYFSLQIGHISQITYVMANSNAYADSLNVIIVESWLEAKHNRNSSCRLRSLLG